MSGIGKATRDAAHAASDPIVGNLGPAGGMYRDEVRLSDLCPELQALCRESLRNLATGESLDHWKREVADYAVAFARTVKHGEVLK